MRVNPGRQKPAAAIDGLPADVRRDCKQEPCFGNTLECVVCGLVLEPVEFIVSKKIARNDSQSCVTIQVVSGSSE